MSKQFVYAVLSLLLLLTSGTLRVAALGSWFKTYEQLGNDALPKDPALASKYFDLASRELYCIDAPIEALSTLDFFRAKAAVCQGDKAHAVALLRQSLDENASPNVDAHCIQQKNLLAELLFELRQYDEAEKIAQEIQRINVNWGGWGNPQPTIVEALCNFRRGDESIYRAKMLEGLSRCLTARYQSELFGQCPSACEFVARHDFEALAQFCLIYREYEAALPLLMFVVESNGNNSAKSPEALATSLANDNTLALCLAMVGRIKDADRLNLQLADAYMLKFPEANWIDLQTQRTMQLCYLSDCEKAFGRWDDRTEDARCNLFTGVGYQNDPSFVREQLNKHILEATSTRDSALPNQHDDCLAQMLFWRGALNLKQNEPIAAQIDLEQSLHLREKLSTKQKQSVFELSNLLTMLAETYSKTHDSAKALVMYQRACDLWKDQPDNGALQLVLERYSDFLTSINKKDAVEGLCQKYHVNHPKMNHLVYSNAEVLCF